MAADSAANDVPLCFFFEDLFSKRAAADDDEDDDNRAAADSAANDVPLFLLVEDFLERAAAAADEADGSIPRSRSVDGRCEAEADEDIAPPRSPPEEDMHMGGRGENVGQSFEHQHQSV